MENGITVTGTGEASQAPDEFRAQLTLGCERSEVSSALTAMGERMSRVAGSGIGPRQRTRAYDLAMPTSGSVDIEGGESTVSVTVTARWSLDD